MEIHNSAEIDALDVVAEQLYAIHRASLQALSGLGFTASLVYAREDLERAIADDSRVAPEADRI